MSRKVSIKVSAKARPGASSGRAETSAADRQYSLFAAAPSSPPRDPCHFRRQAQLCERLLSAVHQPDLVEQLGRLHAEFEAAAQRIEAGPAVRRRAE
jgi:hypothetical protein